MRMLSETKAKKNLCGTIRDFFHGKKSPGSGPEAPSRPEESKFFVV